MTERSFQRFAAAAAIVVGLSSLLYGLIFLFIFPAEQKGAPPASLTSFAANPTPLLLLSVLLALGGLAATPAVVGIYHRLREGNEGFALWSCLLGISYGVLTALQAVYQYFLALTLSALYARNDPAIQAAAIVLTHAPSPVNTFGFSKFFLSGLWLVVTGALMLRSAYFARALGYLALAAGIGVILLFIGQASNSLQLILATGVPGSAVIGPLFWLWVGYTLWRKE